MLKLPLLIDLGKFGGFSHVTTSDYDWVDLSKLTQGVFMVNGAFEPYQMVGQANNNTAHQRLAA